MTWVAGYFQAQGAGRDAGHRVRLHRRNLAAREAYISGTRGIGELTSTVQSCVTLWENGLSLADVSGTDLLDRRSLAMAARALALRGEVVFAITDDGLVAASDWDLSTRNGARAPIV